MIKITFKYCIVYYEKLYTREANTHTKNCFKNFEKNVYYDSNNLQTRE